MCELVIKTAKQNGDLMHNNCKYFIYRGFEIIENPHSFNIYYEIVLDVKYYIFITVLIYYWESY